ncbi:MAG: hypothetical protein HWE35_18325 [Rhodobacteraceae bacterium]|nr:hypothetical protein [Paracoccaceae bacterium]
MSKQQPSYKVIDGLKGSEQHHPLKNRPGEKGEPDHAAADHTEKEESSVEKGEKEK